MTQKSQTLGLKFTTKILFSLGLAGVFFVGWSNIGYAAIAISEEFGGDTSGQTNISNTAISDEVSTNTGVGEGSFTTLTGGGGGGGSTNSGGGGGSSGGSGGGYTHPPQGRVLGVQFGACRPFLLKYIKYGAANDPYEVRKLQAFLRIFEGNDIAITGVYDLPTYNAVHAFQRKYQSDVLGPWRISETTGYVFITTTMAINNVFCNQSTLNTLDLSDYYPDMPVSSGQSKTGGEISIPWDSSWTADGATGSTGVATTTAEDNNSDQFIAAAGTVQFIKDWWFAILLISILFVLAVLVWRMRDDEDIGFTKADDDEEGLADIDFDEPDETQVEGVPEQDSRQQKLDNLK